MTERFVEVQITKKVRIPAGCFSYDPGQELLICNQCKISETWPGDDAGEDLHCFVRDSIRNHWQCAEKWAERHYPS